MTQARWLGSRSCATSYRFFFVSAMLRCVNRRRRVLLASAPSIPGIISGCRLLYPTQLAVQNEAERRVLWSEKLHSDVFEAYDC